MSARRSRYDSQKQSEKTEAYSLTIYDTELARLASERNQAYGVLEDLDRFARGLTGDYLPVGEHILRIMYGDNNA